MSLRSIWLGSAMLVLTTLFVAGGLGLLKYLQFQAQMQLPPPPEMPTAVTTSRAAEITFRRKATMIGTVLAPRSIILSNEIAGTVSSVHFRPGQTVEKDDVLVELDTSVLKAQLESARARAQRSTSTLKRFREAARASAVTPSELEEAEAALTQANAEVNELQAVIRRKTLRAPFRARIGLSDTHEGQFLPSGTEIVSLQSLDDFLYVDFMIPQTAAASVRVGQTVELRTQQRSFEGQIQALDSRADRNSRNIMGRARVALEQDETSLNELVPGQSVEVFVEYGQLQPAVAVPLEALQSSPMQAYVFVVVQDEEGLTRARERLVVPGPTIDGQLCIMSGLTAGDEVVASGAFKLHDGALISSVDEGSGKSQSGGEPPVQS